MKITLSWRRHYYLAMFGTFLVAVALIVGMVGCGGGVEYDLTIASTAGGNVTTPGEGTFTYAAGTEVDLVTEAEEGYHFVKWTGDVGSIANACAAATIITMNGDYSITANFQEGSLFCIDFEDPPLVTEYHLGDTFTDSDAVIDVEHFQWPDYTWCDTLSPLNCGYTKASDDPSEFWPGGSGQHMCVSVVNLRITYNNPWEGLSLLYCDSGGNINVEVNGVLVNKDDFKDLPLTIDDVDVGVSDFGNGRGILILSGTINSFAIGGEELGIDDVCLTIAS
jgi:hypothetical protein